MTRGWGDRGSSRAWRTLRLRILDRDQHRCQLQLADCTTIATHVHHTAGWTGKPEDVDPNTLQAACANCNLKYGDPTGSDPAPKPWKW